MRVTIKANDYEEYEVPTPTADAPDSVYFTDCKYDAFDTARHHHGILADIVFVRGSYNMEDA